MTSPLPSISFIVPCYNEEAAISSVMAKFAELQSSEAFKSLFSEAEILVVNDASTDNTLSLLKEFTDIQILNNSVNLGYGASLKKGFTQAKGDYIAFLDMDDSYDPRDLCDLYNELQEKKADMVFGTRLNARNGMPFIRNIGNHFFAFLIRFLFRQNITDACTGFRIFKRELIPDFVNISSERLNYSIDLTLKVLLHKKVISQVPIRYHDRKGQSKLNAFTDGLSFLRIVLIHFYRFKTTSK